MDLLSDIMEGLRFGGVEVDANEGWESLAFKYCLWEENMEV